MCMCMCMCACMWKLAHAVSDRMYKHMYMYAAAQHMYACSRKISCMGDKSLVKFTIMLLTYTHTYMHAYIYTCIPARGRLQIWSATF